MMKRVLIGLAYSCAIAGCATAQEEIPMQAEHFDLSQAKGAEFKTVRGREALCFEGGVALVKGRDLPNGTIMVDAENTSKRYFANVIFRAEDAKTHEAAYLRMHKSRQLDAMQYNVHLNTESNWQLFGDHQRPADFGDGDWVSLEVAFAGDKARFAAESSAGSYVLPVGDLTLDETGTGFGLRALFPACFSNFRISSDTPDLSDVPTSVYEISAGTIMDWQLSPVAGFEGFAETARVDAEWETVQSEANGTLLISRYRTKLGGGNFEANALDLVYAGARIHSDRARTVAMNFDVSDMGRLYLNGKPLVELNNSFRAKGNALFRGDFNVSTQTVMLALQPGMNELVFAVAERANGWGHAAEITDMTGLEFR
jgi:hypothetical protein